MVRSQNLISSVELFVRSHRSRIEIRKRNHLNCSHNLIYSLEHCTLTAPSICNKKIIVKLNIGIYIPNNAWIPYLQLSIYLSTSIGIIFVIRSEHISGNEYVHGHLQLGITLPLESRNINKLYTYFRSLSIKCYTSTTIFHVLSFLTSPVRLKWIETTLRMRLEYSTAN